MENKAEPVEKPSFGCYYVGDGGHPCGLYSHGQRFKETPWYSIDAGPSSMNPAGGNSLIALVPSEFSLSQNYPNPFIEKTTVKFCVAYRTRVRLEILTAEGKNVRTLVDEDKAPGTYEVECDVRGECTPGGNASDLSEGVYVCRFLAGDFLEMKEIIVQGYPSSPAPSPQG